MDPSYLITFDCYGTLIDWEAGIVHAFQSEAARDGVSLEAQDIISAYMLEEPRIQTEKYRAYRDILDEAARAVARRLDWETGSRSGAFLAESLPEWPPFPDTNAALERLSERHNLGILSNTDDDLLEATRRHLTVEFEVIVTAQQVKSYKPSLLHFHEALRRNRGVPILHAAQSYFHDVRPARELNIPVVWVNRKREEVPFGGPAPTHEVRDLEGLADLLQV